jgi:hypothetical protein
VSVQIESFEFGLNISYRKKQLTHRISGWGFEKNVKRKERVAIIQSLGLETKTASFETKTYRGRTLGKAKLGRWMKMEGISFNVAKDEVQEGGWRPHKCGMWPFMSSLTVPFSDFRQGSCFQYGGST